MAAHDSSGGHFARLLEVLRPSGGIMFIVEGYFDESGSLDEEPRIFCISGYFVTAERAKIMDAEWGAVLHEHAIPYFHMVDCAHGVGVFAGKSKEERTEIVRKLIALIKKYTAEGFSAVVHEDLAETAAIKHPDGYSACVHSCIGALRTYLEMAPFFDVKRANPTLTYFFETGHKNRGRAYNHVADVLAKASGSLTFAKKEEVRLLQAADLLAWQTVKYVKDRDGGKRGPRADFKSLMEHPHMFAHMSKKSDALGLEAWPLSRRSPTTVHLTLGKEDDPLTFLFEEGEKVPIIPVKASVGWKMGGGRMAYVRFKDVRDKEFALGFDEPRLLDAISILLATAEIYAAKPEGGILLGSRNAAIEKMGDERVLCVILNNGVSLRFHLSDDALERLKAQTEPAPAPREEQPS